MKRKNSCESSDCRERMLALQEKLLTVEQDRMDGKTGITLNAFDAMLSKAIDKSES